VWLRSLIHPPSGYGLAYLDWQQQEFAIAAVLAGDAAMLTAYESGDPYLAFAKQAGAVPPEGVRQEHEATRELFKQCTLAVGYGMQAESLAHRIGQLPIVARDLLRAHRETYRKFWSWSDAAVDQAMLTGSIQTVFGWPVQLGERPNPRSLRNFPCQANGAEMLRLAASFATEQGVEVCALIHDAVLIAAPLDQLGAEIERMRAAMAKASRVVLDGFELRVDAHPVRHPDRYRDKRGAVMWERVMRLITECEQTPQQRAAS
jgi:DNA polymerase I-like protein with 3'-5' exonuclease and polymerase domains